MAQVVKATVGSGSLGPGQTTWWKWFVYDSDAWYFWASNFSWGAYKEPVPHADVEVVRMVSRWEYPGIPGEIHKHPALIQLHNPGPNKAHYTLRVVRVH
jgi:hypothetical protein